MRGGYLMPLINTASQMSRYWFMRQRFMSDDYRKALSIVGWKGLCSAVIFLSCNHAAESSLPGLCAYRLAG